MKQSPIAFSSLIFFSFLLFSFTPVKNQYSEFPSVTKNLPSSWEVLFDGSSLDQWRGFKQETIPKGWVMVNGDLVCLGKGDDLGGDIMTKQQFEDFELELEWAISSGGNSGIFFHVLEAGYPTVYASGPEYQIIDDIGFPDKLEEWLKTGANYAMDNPHDVNLKPVGEFNKTKIRVKDGNVRHYLNGKLVVEYNLWTDEWKTKVQNSKWKDYPAYGLALKGHIALQDHGSEVRFRNIKIKDLTNKGELLFNGVDLEGWRVYGKELWYVNDKELVCESGINKDYGYLASASEYKNFILRLKFKQESNGNSGVFFRSTLDGTNISGWQVEIAPKGKDTGGIYESGGRGWLYQIPPEKENILKEKAWNDMVIMVKGDRVMTWLNNELMTDLTDENIGKGKGVIALQIHDGGGVKLKWKDIYIREL